MDGKLNEKSTITSKSLLAVDYYFNKSTNIDKTFSKFIKFNKFNKLNRSQSAKTSSFYKINSSKIDIPKMKKSPYKIKKIKLDEIQFKQSSTKPSSNNKA